MNLYKQFVKEKGFKKEYLKWLEKKMEKESNTLYDEPKAGKNAANNTMFLDDNNIWIEYENPELNYEVEVVFSRHLNLYEQEQVENIINYWSALPFVSVEGNNGIKWLNNNNHRVIINIDFTKSASDDISNRKVLEQLGEWIWQGTPIRKRTGDKKWEGVIRPVKISSGSM